MFFCTLTSSIVFLLCTVIKLNITEACANLMKEIFVCALYISEIKGFSAGTILPCESEFSLSFFLQSQSITNV